MRIQFGSIVAAGSGKLSGHSVYSGGPGAFLRTRNIPRNTQSNAQSIVRNRQMNLTREWRNLTALQRSAWNAAVPNFATSDIFGDIRNPSGFELFCRLNTNLILTDSPQLVLPPASSGIVIQEFRDMAFNSIVESMRIRWFGGINGNSAVLVYATRPLGRAITTSRDNHKLVKVLNSSDGSQDNFWADYVSILPAPPSQSQISFRFYWINRNTGERKLQLTHLTKNLV